MAWNTGVDTERHLDNRCYQGAVGCRLSFIPRLNDNRWADQSLPLPVWQVPSAESSHWAFWFWLDWPLLVEFWF